MLTNMVHHNHQRISKLESLHGKTFYICNKVFYTSCLDPGSDLTLPQGAIVGGDGKGPEFVVRILADLSLNLANKYGSSRIVHASGTAELLWNPNGASEKDIADLEIITALRM